MKYNTKQRREIIDIIRQNGDKHITSEFLLEIIKKKNLNISRATLYRSLDSLVQSGELKKIVVENSKGACYQLCDLEDHHHFHLVCERCGKLIHLDCDKIDELINHISLDHNFKINPSRVVLYGICEKCNKK